MVYKSMPKRADSAARQRMLTTLEKNGWAVEDCVFGEGNSAPICIKNDVIVLLLSDRWELYYKVAGETTFGTLGLYGRRQSQQLGRAVKQYMKHGGEKNEVQF